MGTIQYRNIIISLATAGLILLSALGTLPVGAQGCTGDPCIFYTPTATSTRTPSPTPGPGTPTAVPAAPTVVFPHPDYSQPTSIPAAIWPTVSPNGYNPTPFVMPSPLAISITPAPFSTPALDSITPTNLSSINYMMSLIYSTPSAIISGTTDLTGTAGYTIVTGYLGEATGFITDVVSYTDYLSTTVANLTPTETFTIANAPDWYAPALPRPVADVGWTFETLQTDIDAGKRYSISAWSSFFGYVASLPFQLMKLLYQIVQFLGPLGLFLTWLLVMAPIVTYFKILLFIKNAFISLLNFIIKLIGFLLEIPLALIKLVIGFFV